MRRADAKEVRITTQVSEDTWIELKVYAVRKRMSLAAAAQEILERAMMKNIKKVENGDEVKDIEE